MRSMARLCQNLHVKNLLFMALLYLFFIAVKSELITERDGIYDSLASNTRSFNVQNYGAVGNGAHDDTEAFARAWNEACKASGATLNVPRGRTFLVNNLSFQGPCQPDFIFQIDGEIVAPENPSSWKNNYVWLQFQHLQHFILKGEGTIDGRGHNWWGKQNIRPTAIQFNDVRMSSLIGVRVINSPQFHVTLTGCDNVQIIGITIQAPETSPNTDGIDTFISTNIVIQGCTIGTGDDCIGIGDRSSNIRISGITCGPGHGISIGSLGRGSSKADVHSVHVSNCKLKSTMNGLRIKTWQRGSGTATNITYENVDMVNVQNPIIINQHYCGSAASGSCGNQGSCVKISDVTYMNIRGTSATKDGITFSCSQRGTCSGITLNNVDLVLDSRVPSSCNSKNAEGHTIGTVIPSGCFGQNT